MTIIQAISPLDGRFIDEFETTSLVDIQEKLTAARTAADAWSALPVNRRGRLLGKFSELLLAEQDAICDCIHRTTGKTRTEALIGEIYPVLELLAYYRKHARAILSEQAIYTSPFAFPGASACIERKPHGVAAILAPWNYPFQLLAAPLISALFAGNAVVLKPSELCLPVGKLLMDLCNRLDLPYGLVQWVIGDAKVGEQLIDAGPDLVFFTGGLQAGRAVMQRAAQHPIPVLLELGGKDAMLVFADAKLQRACDAALYGAFCNSGQVCVSIERLYVQSDCHDQFLQLLLAGVARIRVGGDIDADLGAMTSERQIQIVRAHYEDALAKGAKASGPLRRDGNFLSPVVLWNVHHGMRVMREETFGPLLPVMAFADEAEAIRLANESEFGLNASVWSADTAKAERIARQLRVGNWAVNDVLKNIGHPGLPFGGVKNSGFGRYHGVEGLLNFTYPVSGLTSHSRLPSEPNWFPYSSQRFRDLKSYIDFVHGGGAAAKRIQRNWPALQAFREYSTASLIQYWRNFKLLLAYRRDH